jgi:transposase InsO family protein
MEKHWPGQVFDQPDLRYEEAMQSYAQYTRERLIRQKIAPILPELEPGVWRTTAEARAERHKLLQQRRQEDADWHVERKAHHQIVDDYRALSHTQRAIRDCEWQTQKDYWAKRKKERRQVTARRKEENQVWHQKNYNRQEKRFWLAILVITDNCTRQCLGLPIFESGAKVTAQEVTDALSFLLPKDLAFLISDQGTHFRSKAIAELARNNHFVQIPIYRHRPQTNGIAERFVRSLKEWLANFSWTGPKELTQIITDFQPMYNNRPHQGLPIPGLSPNEYALRLWLM